MSHLKTVSKPRLRSTFQIGIPSGVDSRVGLVGKDTVPYPCSYPLEGMLKLGYWNAGTPRFTYEGRGSWQGHTWVTTRSKFGATYLSAAQILDGECSYNMVMNSVKLNFE